jgi:hypothetical protein
MGFASNVAKRIRSILSRDKEGRGDTLVKGTKLAAPDSYNMLSTFGYDALSDWMKIEYDLMARFVDYEEMDEYPEIAAALNIFADDSTQPDTVKNKTVWVESKDVVVKERLTDLFDRTLRIEEDVWEICRTLCKYGNDFEELILTEGGVQALNFMPPPTVRRMEGMKGELLGFVQDLRAQFTMTPEDFQKLLDERGSMTPDSPEYMTMTAIPFEDFEVAHFRMRGKHRRSIYGFGALESARWIWKRLMLMEDAALIYRLSRAPSRYAFYVDVGNLPAKEAMSHVNRFKNQLKKQKFVDPQTGKLNLKWNPLAYDEDFFVPVRDGKKSAEIDTITGPAWQHMEDIDYFRAKLFSALGVPKTYLGYEEETGKAKGTLSQEDVRFARTILRVQRELRNGLKKIARVHLAAVNIDAAEIEYDVAMTVPSAIFELAQVEVKNAKLDFADKIKSYVSEYWILSRVLGFSDEEIQIIEKQKVFERQKKAQEAAALGVAPEEMAAEQTEGERVRQLMAGNRDHEKFVEDNFDALLGTNTEILKRVGELDGLMGDLRSAVARRW